MGCRKEPLVYDRLEKKLVSVLTIVLLLSTSLVVVINNVAASDSSDTITTYTYYGQFNETTNFMDEDTVFVNVTVDSISCDPPGEPYYIKALNVNTGEWIKVTVSDNSTNGPWGNNNTPCDGVYWGSFNVSSGNTTQNASGPGDTAVLQVSDGDVINISEIPSSPFDGDDDIAYILITINASGGNNSPPDQPNNEQPGNQSTNVPINVNISWNCTDPDGDPLTFDVYFGSSFPPALAESNTTNTSYNPGTLEYNTTYHWYIVAWDNHNASTASSFWWFHTEINGSGGPPGGNNTGNATVLGFVKDQFGFPISGATVVLNRTDQSQPVQIVSTNDTGYYIFDHNVTAGDYQTQAFKEGYLLNETFMGTILDNETKWWNITLYAAGGGDISVDLDEWYSGVSPAYVMNNSEANLTFHIVMHTGPGSGARLNNITIFLPEGFVYEGNNGTSLTDSSNFTVINTNNMVRWQKSNAQGFFFSEHTYCWFNVSTNASLGAHNFTISIGYGDNHSDMMVKRVFTTIPYYLNGSVKDSNGQPVQGANASITVQSFGMDGCTYVGIFYNLTDANGNFNITGLPVIKSPSSCLNQSGPMGPGAGDEGGLFYTLSAQKNSEANPSCAIGISTSLPSVPITELVRFLQNAEIYLKPAITFRVNVTGERYIWNETTHSVDVVYGLKNFSLMVKDQKLGFPVKEYNTMGGERIFSVPRDRNYSFTIFAEESFPVSIRPVSYTHLTLPTKA